MNSNIKIASKWLQFAKSVAYDDYGELPIIDTHLQQFHSKMILIQKLYLKF